MTAVTKESLARRISQLEGWKEHGREPSLNEEYQLEAYRLLLELMCKEEDKSGAYAAGRDKC